MKNCDRKMLISCKTTILKLKTLKRKPRIKGYVEVNRNNTILNTNAETNYHIMADIMEIAREGALKTQIMYKANLSFTQLNNYIAFLLDKNLITPTDLLMAGKDT